jgi:hypothetical protein
LAIEVGTSLPGARVAAVLDQLLAIHGPPARSGATTGRSWSRERPGGRLQHIQPGNPSRTPTSNASTASIAAKCSTPSSSAHSRRFAPRRRPGSRPTTPSDRTTASEACRRSPSSRGIPVSWSQSCECPLAGKAYACTCLRTTDVVRPVRSWWAT